MDYQVFYLCPPSVTERAVARLFFCVKSKESAFINGYIDDLRALRMILEHDILMTINYGL